MTLDSPFVSQVVFHPRPEDPDDCPQGTPTQTQCDGAVVCGWIGREVEYQEGLVRFLDTTPSTLSPEPTLVYCPPVLP